MSISRINYSRLVKLNCRSRGEGHAQSSCTRNMNMYPKRFWEKILGKDFDSTARLLP